MFASQPVLWKLFTVGEEINQVNPSKFWMQHHTVSKDEHEQRMASGKGKLADQLLDLYLVIFLISFRL